MPQDTTRLSPLWAGLAILLIVALISVIVASSLDLVERELAKRLACTVFGLMLLGAGNILPKIILPIGAGKTGRTDRFAGAIFVLAGLTCVGVAILAPGDQILLIEAIVGISAFVLAGLNWLRLAQTASPDDSAKADAESTASFNKAKAQRMAIFLILNALFWTFLIFVADTVWGDAGAQWMLVPFIIVNSLLAITQMRLVQKARD